jgi:glycosyltransferase involved in cell wall biosynthesis
MAAASPAAAAVVPIGPAVPPLNGFSWVTEQFVKALRGRGAADTFVRTTARMPVNARTLARRLVRAGVTAGAYLRAANACRRRGVRSVYLPVSGGAGKILELPFVWMARLLGLRLYLHHHSFAYINCPDLLARCYLRACGPRAVHIVLGQSMADALQSTYAVNAVRVMSNAAFISSPHGIVAASAGQRPLSIGFLGNVSLAKGVLAFVELCERAGAAGLDIDAHLAGPFEDEALREQLAARLQRLRHHRVWGAVYGEDKEAFFQSIDLLAFPTSYVNEAEPVTILESLARGVPVMATPKGCIPGMLGKAGAVLAEAGFAEAACELVRRYACEPSWLAAQRSEAFDRFRYLHEESRRVLDDLITEMSAG